MKTTIILMISLVLAAPAARAPAEQTDATASGTASPCLEQEAFRASDFWVGEWEVRAADGRLAGYNRIESA